jgi:hypothetical protein
MRMPEHASAMFSVGQREPQPAHGAPARKQKCQAAEAQGHASAFDVVMSIGDWSHRAEHVHDYAEHNGHQAQPRGLEPGLRQPMPVQPDEVPGNERNDQRVAPVGLEVDAKAKLAYQEMPEQPAEQRHEDTRAHYQTNGR